MSQNTNTCSIFCASRANSLVVSNCNNLDTLLAGACTCGDAPVKAANDCLVSICPIQQYSSLIAAEIVRCGIDAGNVLTPVYVW
ncbi:hypothetical protein C8Q78DRAFT_983133 [Trametes maxima]|nr:hypothetical protein C8Q78DRAFT_983133 [Trametes maxima]